MDYKDYQYHIPSLQRFVSLRDNALFCYLIHPLARPNGFPYAPYYVHLSQERRVTHLLSHISTSSQPNWQAGYVLGTLSTDIGWLVGDNLSIYP